ncbi:sugar ABC transporter substrate-binding protein [Micromonospora sp. NPDC005113]
MLSRLIRPTFRTLAVAGAVVLATTLTACGSDESGASTSGGGSAEDGVSVAALISGTNVPYLATYADAMKKKADDLGVDLTVYSADFDASKQAQQFDQAIAAKPDVIVVAAVDAASAVPSLLKAKQAGIPVVASNTGVDDAGKDLIAGFTGPDDVLEGGEAGKLLIDAIGTSGNVAIVEGALGTTAQINRTKGFADELAKSAPGIKVLDKQTGSWDKDKARSVAANFLTRFGDDLDAIFAEDDTMASGVAQAVADANKQDKVKVVGLGGSQQGFDGVKDGSIVGTIIQSPVQDGELAIQAAYDVASGKKIPETQYIKPITVTAANVSDYKAEW